MRIESLIKFIKENNEIDAGLIFGTNNRFYFSGASTSEGILFADSKSAYLLVDSRYFEYCKNTAKNCEVILITDLQKQLKDLIEVCNCKKIAVDISEIDVARFEYFRTKIKPAQLLSDDTLNDFILKTRAIKDAKELKNIEESQKLLDLGYEYILKNVKIGITEEELSFKLFVFLKEHGAQDASFEFIALSGENTSKPHGMPGKREIKYGDLILLDFGVKANGYCSDMTRTFAIGEATTQQKEIYNLVLLAQESAIKQLKPEIPCKEIDKIARDIIKKGGFEAEFGHSLGHSLGLNIHEDPVLSPKSDDVIKPNMVFTVEPGIYLAGKFGVRIEDTVFITQDGCKNITKSLKSELLVIK